jgi:hypothetical protein
MSIRRRLSCLIVGGALSAALVVGGASTAAAATSGSCAGGPVAPGTYGSLTISGVCFLVAGDVTVVHDLVVAPNAALVAIFFGSNLKVGGNMMVQSGASLGLGCGPEGAPCHTGNAADATNDTIGGNLIADGAMLMVIHHSHFEGNVIQTGGGGGVNCNTFPLGQHGPPAYTTYEDNTIGGNAIVEGVHTCWSGFFRNAVSGNVNWDNNITWDGTPETSQQDTILHGDEDGNEIADNRVQGNLNCFGNFPAIQFGDSVQPPNKVVGRVNGQCTAVV